MIPELVMLRRSFTEKGSATVWHTHPGHQVGYVLAKWVEIQMAQTRYVMRPGDLYMIAQGQLHQITEPKGCEEYHGFFDLTATPEYFTPRAAEVANLDWLAGDSAFLSNAPDLGAAFAEMAEAWRGDDAPGRLLARCLFVRVMVTLADRPFTRVPRDDVSRDGFADYRMFRSAVTVIERRYRETRLSVPDIARNLRVSRSFLDKSFHRFLGYGPKEFLQRYRVDRARELLRQQHGALTAVGEAVGFADVFAFSRTFKRLAGVSPSHYAGRGDAVRNPSAKGG